MTDDCYSHMIEMIQHAIQITYTLKISNHILLENGIITRFHNILVSNNITHIRNYIYRSLMSGMIPICTVMWLIDDPILITSDHILDLFKDNTIINICIGSSDAQSIYYDICDPNSIEMKDYICSRGHYQKRFGKIIRIHTTHNVYIYASEIHITRTTASLLLGG